MDKTIEALENHIIVCGAGTTGSHIIRELHATRSKFIAIDVVASRLDELARELGDRFLYIVGDATDDYTLEQAGIAKARGVIAALNDDKDNLFITISASALNGDARIVAKAIEPTAEAKLRRAGAHAVVSPNLLGGVRLVGEMVRPKTLAFIDRLLREQEGPAIQIEEVIIPQSSVLVGAAVSDARVRNTGALVVALHQPDGRYVYNPASSTLIEAGTALVILARQDQAELLRGCAQTTGT